MRIETERLVLREFSPDDVAGVVAYWSDPRYQRYYPEIPDIGQAVGELVGRFIAAQTDEPRRVRQLAITLKADGHLIGNCGVRVNNLELREGNIGYELNPDHWGCGYATEAARAMLAYGFDELGLHRIWAECVADNRGSAHLLEKLGLRREAHFHEHQWYRDRWWDTLIYAMLEAEWPAHRPTT